MQGQSGGCIARPPPIRRFQHLLQLWGEPPEPFMVTGQVIECGNGSLLSQVQGHFSACECGTPGVGSSLHRLHVAGTLAPLLIGQTA